MPVKRNDVKKEDKWKAESLFQTDDLWEKELKLLITDIKNISSYKGKLTQSSIVLSKLIEMDIDLGRRLDKLFTYAHMRNDEDIKNEKYKKFYDQAYNIFIDYQELTSWITPEILDIDDDKMNQYINSIELLPYQFYLQKLLRTKKHVLSENEERLLSMASGALDTSNNAFKALNDGDLKFGEILDSNNNKLELTHSTYYLYLINKDRAVREKAFKQYHNKFNEFPLTMASLLYGKVKEHVFYAKARNFNSTLEASLFYKNIDISVYNNLVSTVKKRINSLHNYLEFRKKRMNLKELHLYDLYVPFVDTPEIRMEYSEACDILLKSVKPLGEEYSIVLKDGLTKDGWVDIYENENKRSGAYSTGCYDSMPFILMNYNGTLNSARTLAHEAGHSMHSYFTHKYQPPVYGSYPIFLAEVASTFNEELFNKFLIDKTSDKKQLAYLINSRIEEIRTTLFRQTMFAEFELLLHKLVEDNIPLTYQLLCKEYRKLNEFYFGESVVLDQEIDIEWARIPHFYYNYYVYQYATGISAAIALYKKVINGGEKDRNDYLNYLKAGDSKFPIDILKEAGVDMTKPDSIEQAINYFDELVEQLKDLEK